MTADVTITEVALRDGLQNEPVTLSTAQKLRLARALLRTGVPSLEVGAFVRPDRVPQMADTDELVAQLRAIGGPTLHALVFNPTGAKRAVESGVDSVRFVVSASDGHSTANAGVPVSAAVTRIESCVDILRDGGVAMEAAIGTAFVCPFDGVTDPVDVATLAGDLAELGVHRLHLADTIGAANPAQIARTVDTVAAARPELELGLHLHNTYGMGLANALEGHRHGVRHFDSALGGIGGCPFAPGAAGNLATDDLVNMLHQLGIDTGLDTAALVAARDELRTLIGRPLDSALAAVPAEPAGCTVGNVG